MFVDFSQATNLTSHTECVYVCFHFQLSLSEGCRLPVRMNGTEDWPLAEIISIRDVQGSLMFYVHYVDCKCTGRRIYLHTNHQPATLMLGARSQSSIESFARVKNKICFTFRFVSQQTFGRMGDRRLSRHEESAISTKGWHNHRPQHRRHNTQKTGAKFRWPIGCQLVATGQSEKRSRQ